MEHKQVPGRQSWEKKNDKSNGEKLFCSYFSGGLGGGGGGDVKNQNQFLKYNKVMQYLVILLGKYSLNLIIESSFLLVLLVSIYLNVLDIN